jgi:hypothetical protein
VAHGALPHGARPRTPPEHPEANCPEVVGVNAEALGLALMPRQVVFRNVGLCGASALWRLPALTPLGPLALWPEPQQAIPQGVAPLLAALAVPRAWLKPSMTLGEVAWQPYLQDELSVSASLGWGDAVGGAYEAPQCLSTIVVAGSRCARCCSGAGGVVCIREGGDIDRHLLSCT